MLYWLTEGATEESIQEFETKLTMPPPNTNIRKDDPYWSREAEMSFFRKNAK